MMKKIVLVAIMVMGASTLNGKDGEKSASQRETSATPQVVVLQNNVNQAQRRANEVLRISPKFLRAQRWFARSANGNDR